MRLKETGLSWTAVLSVLIFCVFCGEMARSADIPAKTKVIFLKKNNSSTGIKLFKADFGANGGLTGHHLVAGPWRESEKAIELEPGKYWAVLYFFEFRCNLRWLDFEVKNEPLKISFE